jgi:hypothetical protein
MGNNTKSKTNSDSDSELTQFAEFGGVADLDINIRIPSSFYESVKGILRSLTYRQESGLMTQSLI